MDELKIKLCGANFRLVSLAENISCLKINACECERNKKKVLLGNMQMRY